MRVFLIMSLLVSFVFNNETEIKSDYESNVIGSYCVMSMNDYTIVDSYKSEHTQSVASISKIMTAIVAIEEGNLKDKIIVDDIIDQVDGSMLYLQKGDTYTLEDLLYGLMLRSGNDAAVLIAQHVGGSVEDFVRMMNDKAKKLKMLSSTFHNPSGLDEEDGGNISSSCDIAVLMSYAMKNASFAKIVATPSYSPCKGKLWVNKNKFLKEYENATGGKTGYTKQAKRTLVTTSEKDGMGIVSVTLNASDDFNIHKQMHDLAYEKFECVKLIDKGNYKIQNHIYKIENDIYQTIRKGEVDKVKLDIERNKKILDIKVKYGDITKEYTYE